MSRSVTSFVPFLVSAVLLNACAAPSTSSEPMDPKSASDVTLASDSPEAAAILAFLNDGGTTVDLLDVTVGLDSRAAQGIVEHRDGADLRANTSDDDRFETLSELDAIDYVGPSAIAKLSAYASEQGWVAGAPGTFEQVAFSAEEVAVALDLVNNAPQDLLDVDARLDSRAAQNIVDARPIHSLTELVAVPWVGPSAMRKIHGFLPFWEAATQTPEIYDGVVFTAQEAAQALKAANEAEPQAFTAIGMNATQKEILTEGRPWASVEQISDTYGIGPATMNRLRLLGANWVAQPYTLNAGDAGEFAANAKLEVANDDAAWIEALQQELAGDLTGDATFVPQTTQAVLDAVNARIDAYAEVAVGRSYSSRPAAQSAFFQFATGLANTVSTDYPDGALTVLGELSESAGLQRAKLAIVHYFETVEVYQPDFQSNIGRSWDEVQGQVKSDAGAFEQSAAYYVVRDGHTRIFVGDVYGLHTEATVDDVGKAVHVLIEVD